jgi:hypothetical protein
MTSGLPGSVKKPAILTQKISISLAIYLDLWILQILDV